MNDAHARQPEWLLTSRQMREIEAVAIKSGAVTGAHLMEVAGQGVVAALLDEWPALARAPHRAVVLAGPGNNGGDGYVIARLLRARGWEVAVYAMGAPDRLPPDARLAFDRWAELGPVHPLAAASAQVLGAADLVIDALLGTGLARPFEHPAAVQADLAAAWRARRTGQARQAGQDGPRVVAVDLPSGLCADSGRVLGAEGRAPPRDAIHADLTVTFETEKLGHRLAQGPALCGVVRVVPLGRAVAAALADRAPGRAVEAVAAPSAAMLAKAPFAHKYDHGHVLVLGGGVGRGGAARLAARAALRVGAGLVTLGVPGAAVIENAARLDAVMLARCDDGAALSALLADRRLNALALGPGLGLDGRADELIAAALEAGRPTVLDADALSRIAAVPELRARLHPACVLTPHGGEFARLVPEIAAARAAPARVGPAMSDVDAAREAARALGVTLLLKGPATVIATPEGAAWVHGPRRDPSAAWLATAGSGDVLTGLIAGLLGRGLGPARAAFLGAWLHGAAAGLVGPGLIAEDLPEALPAVLRALGD